MDENLRKLVGEFLSGAIDVRDFDSRFALCYIRMRRMRKSSELLHRVVLPLAEFSRGDRSLPSLREALKHALLLLESNVVLLPRLGYADPKTRSASSSPLKDLKPGDRPLKKYLDLTAGRSFSVPTLAAV